jgi:hypothetical protein
MNPVIPGWRLAAQVTIDPPPAGWRDALAMRLGARPRRIGAWAELALHGAWQCLDAAGETALPADARLRVSSLSGPREVTCACLAQLRAGIPLPFDFMQSQPALMLAALVKGLGWQGDASYFMGRDLPRLASLALHGAGPGGLLMGQVEEGPASLSSVWWRWVPARSQNGAVAS